MANPRIDPAFFRKLKARLDVSDRRIYQRVEAASRRYGLEPRLAALAMALDAGININQFASAEDWAELRKARSGASTPVSAPGTLREAARRPAAKKPRRRRGNSVYVVHGRNIRLRDELNAFLRAAGFNPIEYEKGLYQTNRGSPYTGEVLDVIFRKATAIVVLFTPDDLARLKPKFLRRGDGDKERKPTGQPRPNVLFEAGMAYGRDPKTVVIVEIGKLRGLSNLDGRHVVRMDGSPQRRKELVQKLRATGCTPDDPADDWLDVGEFSLMPGE